MFTQPVTAPTSPGLSVTSASATTVSPASPTSRSGRLRGLSYLRTYTQQHLLNRDSGSGSSTPTAAQQQSPVSHSSRNLLTRSISYTPTSSTTSPVSATPPTRPSAPEPAAAGAVTASSSSSTQATVAGGSSRTAVASTSASRTTNKRPAPQNESASDSERAPRTSMTRNRSATASDAASAGSTPLDILPSIRFSTFYDPRATRPSLTFTPVSRTLPTGGEVIRVGRYSERDTQQNVPTNVPSAAPVGFKSKVVSRRHCEFWYEEGKWYIKDVKSSSGTFLNHIRLSPPGTESKPFPVNDGDIVQLGIDFKGGEEMIFRCVKMRLELNRGWQNKLNTFNLTTHKRLRNMTMSGESGGAPQTSQDCSICLSSIAPCQCLFVAPCSHTWHYKCIRSLLTSPQYPIFICPNCRAAADLEAEVEDPEEWQQLGSDDGQASEAPAAETAMAVDPDETQALEVDGRPEPPQQQPAPVSSHPVQHSLADSDMEIDPPSQQPPPPPPAAAPAASSRPASAEDATMSVSHATSHPVPIPNAAAARRVASEDDTGNSTPTNEQRQTRTPSPVNGNPPPNAEGPITPRNDAGPWVFDGSGVRTRSGGAAAAAAGRASTDSRRGEMRSLDAAAEMLNQQN